MLQLVHYFLLFIPLKCLILPCWPNRQILCVSSRHSGCFNTAVISILLLKPSRKPVYRINLCLYCFLKA